MTSSILIWQRIDHARVREQLRALGEAVSGEILRNELLGTYRDHRRFQDKYDDLVRELLDDCVHSAYGIWCNNSNQPVSTDFKRVVWEHGIDLFISGSPQQGAEDGLRTRVGRFVSSSQTGASAYRDRQRDIPYLLQFALNVGPLDSVGDASEKKGRIRRITEWLSSQWKYKLAPTPEMLHAVALLTRAQARTQLLQQEATGGYPKTPDTASAHENEAIETQAPHAASPAQANTEDRQASAGPDWMVNSEQSSGGPTSEAGSKDSGRSFQEPSTQRKEPPAADSPAIIPGSDLPEQFRDITERTYFIIDAEALVHSQDRPGELVAAYSTKDPYLKDLTLVCLANSSMDLLEQLNNKQAGHQKLLIHWGESEEELEQLPDILGAYLSLKETGKTVSGRYIGEVVQSLRSFFESERKKPGRPRQDALSKRVQELRGSGHSWGAIRIQLNKETGVERTIGAYRNLLKSRQKPDGT